MKVGGGLVMVQPAFTHGLPNYVLVCVLQTITHLMDTIWRNTQYGRLEVLEHVMKQIEAFGDLVGRVETKYDDPVYLTDADKERGIHVLYMIMQIHKAGDLYEAIIRSDKPRTEIEICQRSLGELRAGKGVNVFQPIFDDELGVKGWRDEP
jgi:hypothetical protein